MNLYIMDVLLPQPIEPEAIALLENENCATTTTPNPKPVLPQAKKIPAIL